MLSHPLLFLFVFRLISSASAKITIKRHKILFDDPRDAFEFNADPRLSLQKRLTCTSYRHIKYQIRESTTGQEQMAKRMAFVDDIDEDNGDDADLESFTQTFRKVPIYGSSQVYLVSSKSGLYERRDNRPALRFDVREAERLYFAAKLTKSRCVTLCKRFYGTHDNDTVDILGADDFYYLDEPKRLLYVRIVRFQLHRDKIKRTCIVDTISPGRVVAAGREGNSAVFEASGIGGNSKTLQYTYGPASSGATYGPILVDQQPDSTVCTMINGNIATYSGCFSTSPAQFTCDSGNSDSGYGSFSPLNDCHYFVDQYQTFITEKMGISQWFPSNSTQLTVRVVTQSDCDLINENPTLLSSIDCTQPGIYYGSINTVVFGRGCDSVTQSNLYNLCSCPDIVGHEMGHALTDTYSQLTFGGGGFLPNLTAFPQFTEAACVNEGFSDLFGEAFEFWLRGYTDYLVGSNCTVSLTAIRSLINPSASSLYTTGGIGNIDQYSVGVEGHQCAGIFGLAYYTLAQTAGWDPIMAAQPFVLANQCYWLQQVTMKLAACSVLNAATALFGASASSAVEAAFSAVGITDLCASSVTVVTNCVTISGFAIGAGDLILFRLTIPESLAGKPSTVLFIQADPFDYTVLFVFGDVAPNFDNNQNPNLQGVGGFNDQYFAVGTIVTGDITFAVYGTHQLGNDQATFEACASTTTVTELQVTSPIYEDENMVCPESISGISWSLTYVTQVLIYGATVTPTSHITYGLSLQFTMPATSDTGADSAFITLYISVDSPTIVPSSALQTVMLSPTNNWSATAKLPCSSTNNLTYYITMLGYHQSVEFTEITFAGLTITFCAATESDTFDPLTFIYPALPVISTGGHQQTDACNLLITLLVYYFVAR